jgi:hypothetical protein
MNDLPKVADVPELYEPPRVERVLTPAELEREFRYAGEPDGSLPL